MILLKFNEYKEEFKRKVYSVEIGETEHSKLTNKKIIAIKIRKPDGSYSRDHFAKILRFENLSGKNFVRLKRLPEYPHKIKKLLVSNLSFKTKISKN